LVCDAERQQTIGGHRASAAGLHRLLGIEDVDHRASFANYHGGVGGRRISLEGRRDIDVGLSASGFGVAEVVLQLLPGLFGLRRRDA
jgi:hypothetical protein